MNLHGVFIPDYELDKPELVAVLKGHVKEKILYGNDEIKHAKQVLGTRRWKINM